MKAEDFKENMMVQLLPGFSSKKTGEILNTSQDTTDNKEFPSWKGAGYKTVLEACKSRPQYFKIVGQINNTYSLY